MFVEGDEDDEPAGRPDTAAAETPLGLLERRICELAIDISAATCRWLTMVAEFDRRRGHERAGFISCTAWLAWSCGLTPRAARERLRVAHSLTELPRIRAAFAAGRLSYSKVRALTRLAAPDLEAELLELADHATAAQLERTVRGLRQALAEEDPEATQERRHLSLRWEEDGMLRVSGRLPAEEGEQLIRAIELAREALQEGGEDDADADGPTGRGDHRRAGDDLDGGTDRRPDRADALNVLAETLLAQGPGAASGGERNQVVVHVDLERLSGRGEPGAPPAGKLRSAGAPASDGAAPSGGAAPASGGAAVGAGGFIGAETARRIACDAALVTLVERAGEPVSVGRRTRAIPPAVSRALRARDRGCRFPGCGHDRFVDAHHIQHWAAGGETSLGNLVLLCRHHHRLLHEGGFSVERGAGGESVFRRPDGRAIEPRRGRSEPQRLRRLGAAPVNRSGADPLDLDHAVAVLAGSTGARAVGASSSGAGSSAASQASGVSSSAAVSAAGSA